MLLLQAVEKLIVSKLLVEGSNKRIYNVDHHVGMVSSWIASSCPGDYLQYPCVVLRFTAIPVGSFPNNKTGEVCRRSCTAAKLM